VAEPKSAFTNYAVEPDGSTVRLDGRDEKGEPFSLRLSVDELGSLAMTLPSILERALRLRYRDDTLRYVYGLGSWTLEAASEADVLILNLATVDGFSASYGLKRSILGALAEALADERARSRASLGTALRH
jgi:hypothetical protein